MARAYSDTAGQQFQTFEDQRYVQDEPAWAGPATRTRNDAPAQSWGDSPAQTWDDAPAQSWNDAPAQSWDDAPAPSWDDAPAPSWGDPPAQNWWQDDAYQRSDIVLESHTDPTGWKAGAAVPVVDDRPPAESNSGNRLLT